MVRRDPTKKKEGLALQETRGSSERGEVAVAPAKEDKPATETVSALSTLQVLKLTVSMID